MLMSVLEIRTQFNEAIALIYKVLDIAVGGDAITSLVFESDGSVTAGMLETDWDSETTESHTYRIDPSVQTLSEANLVTATQDVGRDPDYTLRVAHNYRTDYLKAEFEIVDVEAKEAEHVKYVADTTLTLERVSDELNDLVNSVRLTAMPAALAAVVKPKISALEDLVERRRRDLQFALDQLDAFRSPEATYSAKFYTDRNAERLIAKTTFDAEVATYQKNVADKETVRIAIAAMVTEIL
jgi:hypothetical protein